MVKQNITDLALKFVKYQTRVINTQNGGGRTQTLEKFNVYSRKLNKYTTELNDAGVNVNTLRQLVMRGGADREDVERELAGILTDHNNQIRTMVDAVDARNTRIEELNKMLTDLVAKYRANERIINGLRDRIGVLEQQQINAGNANGNATTALRQQIAQLEAQLTAAVADNARITVDLEACITDKAELKGLYDALQAELVAKQAELDAVNAQIADLQQQLQESRVRADASQQEIARLQRLLDAETVRANGLQDDIGVIHTRAQAIRVAINAGAVINPFAQLPPQTQADINTILAAVAP